MPICSIHPTSFQPSLSKTRSEDLDLVVASRYCADGSAESFNLIRSAVSQTSAAAARLLFPSKLSGISDPMSGFFLVRRSAIAVDELRPSGFKILLEILTRSPASSHGRAALRVR